MFKTSRRTEEAREWRSGEEWKAREEEMAHQDVDEDDLHGLQHHMDAHGQLMGQVMPRHGQTTYVPGPLMMDYDMGAPNSYGVPHVLPGHPTQMMLMPMNAPTPTMSMSMPQAPPAAERGPPKKRGRAAATQLKEEIHEQMAAPKKRAAPKRKKSAENGRPAASKRAAVSQPVPMHSQELVPNMVHYVPNMQMVLQSNPSKDGSVVVDQHSQPIGQHPGHPMSHAHAHSHQMPVHSPHGVMQQDDPNNPGMLGSQAVMQSMTRPRATDETRAAQRSANALREYQRRARETPPERAARRAANAARARQRRAEESPEERFRRLHREALRQQRRRDNETERERAARRAANALRQQERRAREAMARQQQAQIREMSQQQVQMQLVGAHEQPDDVHNHDHYLGSVDDDQE